ncbi:OSBPL10 [Bugula neritina]|uniref:Oxysterol-binding protein n=1 Tax=Bugula neritina TaxID=10212 RepID=A0A7J7JWP5_BUGNE|nr:OSBPL10 [Bugula neritina]
MVKSVLPHQRLHVFIHVLLHHDHEICFIMAVVDSSLSKPLRGLLSKYTNVVKGWQYRWFVLYPDQGTVEYYEREELVNQKPRGAINLHCASVAPSEEDSVTFTIYAANGEVYKLRADNTKTRQLWVSRLMYVTQVSDSRKASTVSLETKGSAGSTTWSDAPAVRHSRRSSVHSAVVAEENRALAEVKEYVNEVCTLEVKLAEKIESLPSHGDLINSLDQDMLLLKACSKATAGCLDSCLSILDQQHAAIARQSFKKNHLKSGAKVEWIINNKDKSETDVKLNGDNKMSHLDESSRLVAQSEIGFTQPLPMPAINHEDEVTDSDAAEEKDLGEMEQHKTIILHLLSQLKLGMDLTKVVLPTFILEKRSLLEMFADCMAHPDTFLRIADMTDPRARMTQVVEWYLASFHEGRKFIIIVGVVLPRSHIILLLGRPSTVRGMLVVRMEIRLAGMLYVAEQVSHHPPVSAFHITCPEKQIHMTGSLWTKSKFMGMSLE